MQAKYTIRREAFLNAINQFDISTLSDELQKEINVVRNALNEQATEDTIKQLNHLLQKCEPLKQLYDTQRRNLKKQESEQERSKGFPVKNDNPKSEELGARNINPPTPNKTPDKNQKKP
ncbi:MAG: hypothetical protein QNJ49_16575 [Mastigocoleus sp. MO_167.B18]|nr:hypothetical protein [Mastigocoleus sp. MO_167.B18]